MNSSSWRDVIEEFITKKMQDELNAPEKNKGLDEASKEAQRKNTRQAWLHSAAQRVRHLKTASHIFKPMHPSAEGTRRMFDCVFEPPFSFVCTAVLPISQRALDIVGTAAVFDVIPLLKLTCAEHGPTLLDALTNSDDQATRALHSDPEQAAAMRSSFISIAEPDQEISSHTLAKQVYFPTQNGYEVLAPLYPTQLVHALFERINQARFSVSAKAARNAKQKDKAGEPYLDFPKLLAVSFGGTKSHNISYLNRERGGNSYLLPNLPPVLLDSRASPPLHQATVFGRTGSFAKRPGVQERILFLRQFLERHRNRTSTIEIRNRREMEVRELMDELIDFTVSSHSLASGWSNSPDCRLPMHQRRWLDPLAQDSSELNALDELSFDPFADVVDNAESALRWSDQVALDFARWLNTELSTRKNVLQTNEQEEWLRLMKRQLANFRRELCHVEA